MSKIFLKCPKCSNTMKKIEHASIVVDRCVYCYGVWFDKVEVDHLKNVKAASLIDIDNSSSNKVWNEEIEIDCPVCEYRMISKFDREKPHIRFENCPLCYGIFFDAGEFKDYQENTLLAWLKNLVS